MGKEVILDVKNLNIAFQTYGGILRAVRGVNFNLHKGETLAIVGESGCGKTVTAKSIMGILPKDNTIMDAKKSQINFDGKNLLALNEREMSKVRGRDIAMIFQDPMTSLNPTMKVGEQIAESMYLHGISKKEARVEALKMLELVKIPNAKTRFNQYPFEFSGGMRQRAMIAVALACKPKILIADEPTTALDVTIQAQIMDLIGELQKELSMGVVLITHDLGVVASVADRIMVMYAGKVAERGNKDHIFYDLKHPYTYALLKSVPRLTVQNKEKLYSLFGTPPDLVTPPKGCPFAARCEFAMKICDIHPPERHEFGEMHSAACWLHDERADKRDLPAQFLKRGESNGQ
jgi:oligopeptide transport system ATP-binding protein